MSDEPTQATQLQIHHVPVARLSPAEYNPRRISQAAFIELQQSIDQHGFVDPIIANKRPNGLVIVGGHQRWRAAQALRLETVPTVILELDEQAEKALNVRLNNRKSQGEDDADMLAELLHSLDEEHRVMAGYLDDEIQALQDGNVEHGEDLKPKAKTQTKYDIDTLQTLRNAYIEHAGVADPKPFIDWLSTHEAH